MTETSRSPLWSDEVRATTVGLVVIATITAFDHLGVSTAMPRMLAELDAATLYSWPFLSFLAASVTATVLSGRVSDRHGPAVALLAGAAMFLVGLVVAGVAQDFAVLLAGRFLQGAGLGTQGSAIYVLVALVYPERSRPAVLGLLAAAWVLPSVVGPTISGLITEYVGWRWVFLGLVPLAVVGLALLLPTLRRVRHVPSRPTEPARRGLVLAAVAAAAGICVLSWAAQHPSASTVWPGLAAAVVLVPALRVLLPAGTLRARRQLPRVVLARGLFAGAFFAVEAYVPLTLTVVHGYSPALAGLPLTVGAIGWSAVSVWQGRHPDLSRWALVRVGFLILAVGLAGMAAIAPSGGPAWLAAPLWAVAGAGMGLAFPSATVLALRHAKPGERGFVSSALQVSDMIFSAALVGLGGVLLTTVASAARPTAAMVALDLAMGGVAVLGAVLFRRR